MPSFSFTPAHTVIPSQRGVSGGTFWLHSVLCAAPASPGLPGLASAWKFSSTLLFQTLCLTCLNKCLNCLLWIRKQSQSSPFATLDKERESCQQSIFSHLFIPTNLKPRSLEPHANTWWRGRISHAFHTIMLVQFKWEMQGQADLRVRHFVALQVCVVLWCLGGSLFSWNVWRSKDLPPFFHTGAFVNMWVGPVNFNELILK